MNYINFDNNSTTPLYHKIKENILDLSKTYYNQSSVHSGGSCSKEIISSCKENILFSLNTNKKTYNVIFTSSGTESNNLLLKNFNTIAISEIEHKSISWILQEKKNIEIINIDKSGYVDIHQIESFCKSNIGKKFLVSLIYGHHETGVIQKDMKKISSIVHKYNGIIHSDISQVYGKIKLDLDDLDIDILTISGHKIYSGYGCSPLIFKKNINLSPLISGGMQQDGFRSGTENVTSINFMNEVVKNLDSIINEYQTKIQKLTQYLQNELLSNTDSMIIFENSIKLPHCFMIANKQIETDKQIAYFDINKFLIGHGSACKSNVLENETIIDQLNIDSIYKNKEIRISLSIYNTKEEIEQFIFLYKNMILKSIML